MPELSNTQRDQIEKLAYRRWEERGRPMGSADQDWFIAERELTTAAEMSATSLGLAAVGPIEDSNESELSFASGF